MNTDSKLPYIKSLDGLRAIACLMVVFFHSPVPMFNFQFGWAGVNLFFILSGFLITRILLEAKEKPFKIYLKSFYIRRTLRIFPLYFFYLLLVFLLLFISNHFFSNNDDAIQQGLSDFRRNCVFLLTYTYNFQGVYNWLAGIDYHNSIFTGHLWTLSVEEQFYLIFPFFIYFLSKPVLKVLSIFFIVLIPFLRFVFVLLLQTKTTDNFWIGELLYVLTPFQLDALCLGISLALFDWAVILKYAYWILGALVILLILFGAWHLQQMNSFGLKIPLSSLGYDAPVYHVFMRTPDEILNNRYLYSIPLLNFSFAIVMLLAINGKFLPKLLEWKPLVWVGKISYGVYIFHLSVSYVFSSFLKEVLNIEISSKDFFMQSLTMFIFMVILQLVSYLSYKLVEAKFLTLRV